MANRLFVCVTKPGQQCALHVFVSTGATPGQIPTPLAPTHVLTLVWIPPPQVCVQGEKDPTAVHVPSASSEIE